MIDEPNTLAYGSERLLLDELTHRVSNEFAAAMCIVALAAARTAADDARVALSTIQRRLENFARVHRLLQMPRVKTRVDACAYLRQLCDAISLSKLKSDGIELILIEHRLHLDADQCWRLGMILSELITNAACHAFDEGPGRIWVEATYHDSEVTCRVEDSGTGREVGPRGRGLEIIDTLVQELHGRMVQHFGANGSVATLVFPTVAKRPLRAAGLGTQTAAYPSKL